jgi:hypothetical protein
LKMPSTGKPALRRQAHRQNAHSDSRVCTRWFAAITGPCSPIAVCIFFFDLHYRKRAGNVQEEVEIIFVFPFGTSGAVAPSELDAVGFA